MEKTEQQQRAEFPPSSKRVTHRNKAWSNTCFRAFPVCCSHDNGIICLASRASSQWGESNADCSGFKTGAAAGELREELFQGSKCKTDKKKKNTNKTKQTPVFVRQKQASVGRVSQRWGHPGQLWHKYTVKKQSLSTNKPNRHVKFHGMKNETGRISPPSFLPLFLSSFLLSIQAQY